MELSIIIPTYNEKENIEKLISKINKILKENSISGEIITVDDNYSPDGTGNILENITKDCKNLKVIHRQGKFGLSSAVIEGFKKSEGDILCVMDADFSHPPEKIKEMFEIIKNGVMNLILTRIFHL